MDKPEVWLSLLLSLAIQIATGQSGECVFPESIQGQEYFVRHDEEASGFSWLITYGYNSSSLTVGHPDLPTLITVEFDCIDSISDSTSLTYIRKSLNDAYGCCQLIPRENGLLYKDIPAPADMSAEDCLGELNTVLETATWYIKYPFSKGARCPLPEGTYQMAYSLEDGAVECEGDPSSFATVFDDTITISSCYKGETTYEVPLDLSLTCVEHIPEKDITDGSANDQGDILLLGDYTDPDFPLFYCTRYKVKNEQIFLSLDVQDSSAARCAGDHHYFAVEPLVYVVFYLEALPSTSPDLTTSGSTASTVPSTIREDATESTRTLDPTPATAAATTTGNAEMLQTDQKTDFSKVYHTGLPSTDEMWDPTTDVVESTSSTHEATRTSLQEQDTSVPTQETTRAMETTPGTVKTFTSVPNTETPAQAATTMETSERTTTEEEPGATTKGASGAQLQTTVNGQTTDEVGLGSTVEDGGYGRTVVSESVSGFDEVTSTMSSVLETTNRPGTSQDTMSSSAGDIFEVETTATTTPTSETTTTAATSTLPTTTTTTMPTTSTLPTTTTTTMPTTSTLPTTTTTTMPTTSTLPTTTTTTVPTTSTLPTTSTTTMPTTSTLRTTTTTTMPTTSTLPTTTTTTMPTTSTLSITTTTTMPTTSTLPTTTTTMMPTTSTLPTTTTTTMPTTSTLPTTTTTTMPTTSTLPTTTMPTTSTLSTTTTTTMPTTSTLPTTTTTTMPTTSTLPTTTTTTMPTTSTLPTTTTTTMPTTSTLPTTTTTTVPTTSTLSTTTTTTIPTTSTLPTTTTTTMPTTSKLPTVSTRIPVTSTAAASSPLPSSSTTPSTTTTEASICASKPCYNGGTCVLFRDTFFCTCTDRYLGDQCQSLYTPPEDSGEMNSTLVLVVLGVVFVVILAAVVLISRAVAVVRRNRKYQDCESVHTTSSTGFSSNASSSAWFPGYGMRGSSR